jgi:chromate transport protein ChrA
VLMYVVGIVYQVERDRPLAEAALEGIAAAAVGLMLATTLSLGRKALFRLEDLIFVVLTVLCVNWLDLSEPRVLIGLGSLAALWHWRAGAARRQSPR